MDDTDDPERLWCYCKQPDDGQRMIWCDCCEYWYHCDYLGLEDSQVDSLVEDNRDFICYKCSDSPPPSVLKPGRVNRVTFSPGHPGPTRFTNYSGLTRIGSREKRNCSFDDVETYKRYRVALS